MYIFTHIYYICAIVSHSNFACWLMLDRYMARKGGRFLLTATVRILLGTR